MPLALLLARTPQSHTLIQSHIFTHDGGLADHDTHAVINEQSASDFCSGMNFDSGQKPRDLRQPSRGKQEAMIPQPVVDAIEPDGMQSRIAEVDFQPGLGRGVAFQHSGDVLAN